MKFASILISILALGFMAHADEFNNFDNSTSLANATPSVDGMTLTGSTTEEATAGMQQAKMEQPTMFGKENSTWNFNLGMSEFDNNFGTTFGFKGKGLTFEVQKKFWDIFYVGGAYTGYTTQGYQYADPYNHDYTATISDASFGMLSLSLEAHMIRLPLPGRSEFFAAVNGGTMSATNPDKQVIYDVGSSFFYGAGIGVNISNQIGLRADIKSTASVKAYNTVSLVGYY